MTKKFSTIGLGLSLMFHNNSTPEIMQRYRDGINIIRIQEDLPLERENIDEITVLYRPENETQQEKNNAKPEKNNTSQPIVSYRPSQDKEKKVTKQLEDLPKIQDQQKEILSQQDLEKVTENTTIAMEKDPNPNTSNVGYDQARLIQIAENITLEETNEIIKLEEKLYQDLKDKTPELAETRKMHILDFFRFVKEEKEREKAETQRQRKKNNRRNKATKNTRNIKNGSLRQKKRNKNTPQKIKQ